jgi:DNA-directed RNA polymerase sigma subunit (sigma70/sigma32)
MLKLLTPREANTLRMRYGLKGVMSEYRVALEREEMR